jgi:1A family penicillin-binding protein
MLLSRPLRAWRLADWVAALVLLGLGSGSAVAVVWVGRHVVKIRQLAAGVGDTTFHAADGRPWFRMDEQRQDVPLDAIAPILRHAVVAVEDHRFYRHPGLDPVGIARAMVENLRSGERQGASTITQQLARTLFLSNRRTWGRKIKEAVLAVLLEAQLSKAQILELYLNRVYLSSGVYGVEPLARRLFGKPARDVTLPEAAMIAGLIQAPSALSPWSNYEGALQRSRLVLARLREEGYITAGEEVRAARVRPRIRRYEVAIDARGGYAKEYLRQQFRNQFGGSHPPDWQVQTTFVLELQEAAERAVANGLRRAGRRDLQAALVALDPFTGDIVALVGGRDFRASPFNRAVRSRRQPGSAFKPLVYAAALERGWSPVSVLAGLSGVSAPDGDEEWTPRNVAGGARHETTLRQALVESDNRAAVALQQRIGSRAVLALARQVGLEGLPDVPSLALGSGLVTPLGLARAFAIFPGGGFDVVPRAITRVIDESGDVAFEAPVVRRRVISPAVAFQMVSLLEDVTGRGTGRAVGAWGIRFPVAGKTGTTNDFKDAWFVGFSSSLVAAVWVGLDQPAPMGPDAYGARLALPIWAEFMRRAARVYRPGPFEPPPGLEAATLCRISYQQPLDGCPVYTEYFKDGDERPARLCPLHEGSFRQRAERAVEGLIDLIARRLRDVFKR